MMRSKLMLWGAAAAIALSSTATVASVVVVKSLGPSSKAYPPGKTLPESAKITLQGGDIVTVLGPASAQTLARPGQFRRQAGDARVGRRQARPLRSASRRRSRAQSEHLGRRRHPERQDLRRRAATMQLWRPDSDTRSDGADPRGRRRKPGADLGRGQGARPPGRPRCRSPAAPNIRSNGRTRARRASLDFVTVKSPPADLVGAAQVLIENGCQNQLDLLVDGASKVGKWQLADDSLRT